MEINSDLPYFDLEINYDPQQNTVSIIANTIALEHFIAYFQNLVLGSSGNHFHLSQKVAGTIGNAEEIIIIKR